MWSSEFWLTQAVYVWRWLVERVSECITLLSMSARMCAIWTTNVWGAVPSTTLRERERERETFFIFRLCKQATYIIRAQDTVTALLQVQTIEGVGQLGGLKEL